VFQLNFSLLKLSEAIYRVPGDDTKFYAVFTTTSSGFQGSAVCVFTLDAIQDAFKGKFKEQATSSSAWLPVLTSKVPEPRPGECVNDTQTLPGRNFVKCENTACAEMYVKFHIAI
jgi:hypothetical protein